MEVEVAINNSIKEVRQPEKRTKKDVKPKEDKKRKADSMDEASEGEQERRMRKRMKLDKKVKKRCKASNFMLIMGDCALRVKADYATVEVVGGNYNLEDNWEECSNRQREQARGLDKKRSMRARNSWGKVLQNRQGNSKRKQRQKGREKRLI